MDARLSRYSYLVSLLPRQVMADLDLDVRLVRRRYSSYTPLPASPATGLLVDHEDQRATAAAFAAVTGSGAEHEAWQRFYGRMATLAQRVFPTVLEPLRSADAVRELVGDDEMWRALVERPLGETLRATFGDDTVRGIVATDALIGTFADLDGPSLAQNICFLYHLIGGGTGDWDVPVGGMGAVTDGLARAAVAAGAELVTGAEVLTVDPDGEVTWRAEGEGLRQRQGGDGPVRGRAHRPQQPARPHRCRPGRHRAGARGRAAEGQHAAVAAAAAARRARRPARGVRRDLPHQRDASPSCRTRTPRLPQARCPTWSRARSTATPSRTARSSGPRWRPATPRP